MRTLDPELAWMEKGEHMMDIFHSYVYTPDEKCVQCEKKGELRKVPNSEFFICKLCDEVLNEMMPRREVLIMRSNSATDKWTIRLVLKTDRELKVVTRVLSKLGYTFKHPEGR